MTRRQTLVLLAVSSLLVLMSCRPGAAVDSAGRRRESDDRQSVLRRATSLRVRPLADEDDHDHYLLRFDPALFLSGETANQAAAEDGAVPKGQPVPNDNYVVNESRRTYLYTVTRSTRIRVLLRGRNITVGSPVSASTLTQLVHGRRPVRLYEGLESGFWLGVHIDHACSLSQQYRP